MDKKSGNKIKFIVSSEKLSKLRQQLSILLKKRYKHLKVIFDNKALVKGGVYIINHKCGKPTCKCATSSYRHSNYYLYRNENAKTATIYIKADDVGILKKLTGNYIKFRKARAGVMNIEKEMAEVINQIEKEKTIQFIREGKIEKKKKKKKSKKE